MLTAAKSIYLLTMVLLKIFISTQDELSFAGVICIINFLLTSYAVPEIRFSWDGLTPQANCRFLQSTAVRRLLCFDRTGSKTGFHILRKFQTNLFWKLIAGYISISSFFDSI
jgi:hypothetical protein